MLIRCILGVIFHASFINSFHSIFPPQRFQATRRRAGITHASGPAPGEGGNSFSVRSRVALKNFDSTVYYRFSSKSKWYARPSRSLRWHPLHSFEAAESSGEQNRGSDDESSIARRHENFTKTGRASIEYIPDAAVSLAGQPGFVITSRPEVQDANLKKLAIFVFRHSINGSGGFIVDRESFFRLRETMEAPALEPFYDNMLYLGNPEGNSDDSMAMMFHERDLGPSCRYVGGGVYCGGIGRAGALVKGYSANAKEFKFVFGQMNWANNTLTEEIAAGRWNAFLVPSRLVVGSGEEEHGAEVSLW